MEVSSRYSAPLSRKDIRKIKELFGPRCLPRLRMLLSRPECCCRAPEFCCRAPECCCRPGCCCRARNVVVAPPECCCRARNVVVAPGSCPFRPNPVRSARIFPFRWYLVRAVRNIARASGILLSERLFEHILGAVNAKRGCLSGSLSLVRERPSN